MRRSSVVAIIGYSITAILLAHTIFAFSIGIDNFDKCGPNSALKKTQEDAFSDLNIFKAEHTVDKVFVEPAEGTPEYVTYMDLLNALDKANAALNNQTNKSRVIFWSYSIPSLIVTLVAFGTATAIWTEAQKKDI